MASCYSDIIRLRGGKPAYNIKEEKEDEWASFIPNEQFNGVLGTVIKAVRGNDIDNHKSFWINGTYGTGKSHASAVIAHLLSDPVEELRPWVDYEYKDPKYAQLRQSLYRLRETKRLLPVKIYGTDYNTMSSVSDLALVVQKNVVDALEKYGLEVQVQTDYESLIANIRRSHEVWSTIIDHSTGLSSIAVSPDKLVSLLQSQDITAYHRAIDALKAAGLSATLDLSNLGKWLVEVQNELVAHSAYNGLFILWDEFTDVMNSFGVSILKEMQGVAEKFMNLENNSFFCLVSHPSAFNTISPEEVKQTDGRYHRMKYNMESVSAFKIMTRKFEVIDQMAYDNIRFRYFGSIDDVVDMYTANAVDKQTTTADLLNLFPLHPGTANLATYFATVIGSSSRSVFEFLGQNDDIRSFLDSEEHFRSRHVITADYLWDFVSKEFQDDVANYGAVMERYNSYQLSVRHKSEQEGLAYMAVFKAVLLLNAFNNISGEDNRGLVTPSEANIKALFAGTQYSAQVEEALEWLNAESIVQRAPGDERLYSVQFSALPAREIEDRKTALRNTQFKFTSQVIDFDKAMEEELVKQRFVPTVIRQCCHQFYSDEGNDSSLASKIKNGKRNALPSDLFFAFLVARNNEEHGRLVEFAQKMNVMQADDKGLRDIFFVVLDEVFTDRGYDRFIEYMANHDCAGSHGFADQKASHRRHAADLVKDYLARVVRGNATAYVNGKTFPVTMKRFSSECNDRLSPAVFSCGPEALEKLRQRAPQTFWQRKAAREIVRQVLFAQSKEEVWEKNGKANGQVKPIQYFLQDSVDDNMELKPDVPEGHPLKAIYDFVQNRIKHADKRATFNFMEKFEDLTRPPYGLYPCFAAMGAMAFAMRPWVGKIFDMIGKPRDANNLADDINALFKAWDSGRSDSKLTFKFQTPEEGSLCKSLIQLFRLKYTDGYNDITSLKDARWAITGVFIPKKGFPLWSLKYASPEVLAAVTTAAMTDDIRTIIDNVVKICNDTELRNPALVKNTIDLISANRFEASSIIRNDAAYRDGFVNYLKSFSNVGLLDEEIDKALKYISQNLQSTIGYWSEAQVEKALMNWRISTMQKPEPPKPPVIEEPYPEYGDRPDFGVREEGPVARPEPEEPVEEDKKQAAINKIRNERNIVSLRNVLTQLCNEGNRDAIVCVNENL